MAREHAIVLGAGCAGMLAAKVLAEHFRNPTLIVVWQIPTRSSGFNTTQCNNATQVTFIDRAA